MHPAYRRFVEAEHRADLFHVEFLLVIERQNELFALRQRRDRFGERGHHAAPVERGVLVVDGVQPVVGRLVELGDVEQPNAGDLDQHRVVLAEREPHLDGDLVVVAVAAEAQLQFQMRLRLARYGLAPHGKATLRKTIFAHQSEQMFANLLDFYRIAWEYEPRSFPIHLDADGNALEAFTPDFYLPEFNLYVELTTMKQSLVTKKNRKVRLLRELYPALNIQVFYQKDFENLIFKYGLAARPVTA